MERPPDGSEYYIAFTRGDEVGVVATAEELRSFVAPVDTPKDAALLLDARGHRFDCAQPNVTATSSGFALRTRTGTTCGRGTELDEHAMNVTTTGEVTDGRDRGDREGKPELRGRPAARGLRAGERHARLRAAEPTSPR